jgi:two-component system phosphate regulon sensor histidine kinase PhoR
MGNPEDCSACPIPGYSRTVMAQTRTIAALMLVAAGAIGAWAIAGDPQAALMMLVAGVAAVLVLIHPVEAPRAPGGDAPADDEIRHLIESLGDPILILAGTRVVRANAAAQHLLGTHVLGQDVRLALRHPDAARRLAEDTSEPAMLVGLGARDSHWEMQVAPMGRDRRLVHLVDRTRSVAADRMRADFVANASHELRTPLASLLGFIETLEDEKAGGDPALRNRFLGVMAGEAQRMQRLVADLLSLSRIESEKYRLPADTVDLAALIASVADELRQTDPKRGADIALDIAKGLPTVTGDRAQLSQLLHNLVGNAMKYGRAGTAVTIRLVADAPGTLTLTVSDQGEGIAPEHLPRLTERFYRVDSGRSRALGGTGLGLAIVKHIVERHRGRLAIASTPGEGTTMTVLLPSGTGGTVIKA